MLELAKDEFVEEHDSFSISRIDETIARSKRIVEESLAISRNHSELPSGHMKDSAESNSEGSFHFNFEQFSRVSPEKGSENEGRGKSEDERERFKKALVESKAVLKRLEAQERSRTQEMLRFQKMDSPASHSELEEIIKEKKRKIQELSEIITTHSVYRENQELKVKIKGFAEGNHERSAIFQENLKKKALESEYDCLYQAHQNLPKELSKEIQKVRDEIKVHYTENRRKVQFLSNKLQEKILDNQLLTDQIKAASAPNDSKPTGKGFKSEATLNYIEKSSKRAVSCSALEDVNEYTKRISTLESELKKVKQKYKQLKKLYQKKCRKNSTVEAKKPDLPKKKNLIKRKSSAKGSEKCVACGHRNLTPRQTPH